MPHLNPTGVDLVVTAFVCHKDSILLLWHEKLNAWLPPGGHVEPHEDSDEALARELREETGLILGTNVKPVMFSAVTLRALSRTVSADNNNRRTMLQPWTVEVHDFPPLPGHRHLSLNYLLSANTSFVRPEKPDGVLRWCDTTKLMQLILLPSIKVYCREAIDTVAAIGLAKHRYRVKRGDRE